MITIFQEADSAFACEFSVRTNETDHLSLVSKADRFERLVHAGKLRIINRGRLLPVDQRSERRFRFSFVYAEEPRTASSKEKLGRGVIIAITVIACAALLALMLVGMVVRGHSSFGTHLSRGDPCTSSHILASMHAHAHTHT